MSSLSETESVAAPRGSLRGRIATFGALGVRVGAAGLAYILQIVLARSLGVAEYGVFSFAWSLVTIGGFLATLGYGQVAVRFLAQYHEAGDNARAHAFIRHCVTATAIGSVLAIVGLLAAFPFMDHSFGTLAVGVFVIGLLALPFFALTDLIEGFARSQGWTVRALVPPYILRGGLLMLMALGAIGLGFQVDAARAMTFAFFATALACLAQILLTMPPLLRAIPRGNAEIAPAALARDIACWRVNARPTLLADMATLARQNIDLIILALVASPAIVGIYFAAMRIASLLGLIEFALGAAFGHRFARANSGDDPRQLDVVWRESWRLGASLGLVLAALLMLLAPVILALFGPDFVAATQPLRILIAATTIRLMIGPAEDLLTMSGHAREVWHANAMGAVAMGVGCIALSIPLGATGAALGSAVGTLVATLLLARAVRRQLGIAPIAFGGHT